MRIDHVQIDVPETLGLGKPAGFHDQTGAYRDMVLTHLFQILAFMAMEPPTALEPAPISEEKNTVFRSMLPIQPSDVVRGLKGMFPAGSGVGAQGPDHLTFDLADASKMSLLFYGKRPGPGMRLDKRSGVNLAFRRTSEARKPAHTHLCRPTRRMRLAERPKPFRSRH